MKVLFFFSVVHELYARLAEELRARGTAARFAGIAYGTDQARALRRAGFDPSELATFTEYLEKGFAERTTPDEYGLRAWERRHSATLNLMIACDRRYSAVNRETALRVAEICISCVARVLDDWQPAVIVSEGIDCLLSHVLYLEARRRGIPFLITYATPLPQRFAIYSNPDNHWERVQALFAQYLEGSLTASQRTRAEDLEQAYVQRTLSPSYVASYKLRPWSGARLRRDWRTLVMLLERAWYDHEHALNPTYEGGVGRAVVRRFRRDTRRVLLRRHLWAKPIPGESFVLFPLQVEPEVSTSVFAPFCTDQTSIVEHVARSLPVDTRLYVKEHPVMMGRRSLADYVRMKRVPNVRLLAPELSTNSLIADASLVVTITSTVGWEAVMLGKPVVVLGNVWYDVSGLVEKASSVNELPRAMERALDSCRDRERLLRFVAALLDGTYEGEIDNPQYNPRVLDPGNVKHIADAIASHLDWCAVSARILPSPSEITA